MSPRIGRVSAALLAGVGVTSGVVLAAAPASAATDSAERISEMAVAFDLRLDGSMHVTERITYDFGRASDRHGIERFVPVKFGYDAERNRIYPMSREKASSPTGAPADLDKTNADVVTLRIGDADTTVRGVQTYVLEYDLDGVVNTVGGGQELYWNALGLDTAVPVEKASVTVTGPGVAVQRATCFQGSSRSTEPCSWSLSGGTASFRATRALKPHEAFTVVAGFPAGTFPDAAPILRDKWKLSKAFAMDGAGGVGALGLLAVLGGGTGLIAMRRGRDRRYLGLTPGLAPGLAPGLGSGDGEQHRTGRVGWRRAPIAVQFTPPKELTVGELGTLVDEHANVQDVTATIIDLAVRGYLRIEEVAPSNAGEDDEDDDWDEDEEDEEDDWDEETKATFARLGAELDRTIAEQEAKRQAKAERKAARRARWAKLFGRTPPASEAAAAAAAASSASALAVPTTPAAVPASVKDWLLVRTAPRKPRDLREYERELFEAIFSGRKEVRLSQLRSTFAADLRTVQRALYREVTERGWFRGDPESVRTWWGGWGTTLLGAGIVLTIVLAIFTRLAMIGVALTAAGIIVLVLAGNMPARTAAGTALLTQVQGFRLYLETAEADQIRFEEGQDVFSRYLPYAIVFGVAERWADLFAQLAASGRALPAPTWYAGDDGWDGSFDYHRFGTSMSSFSTEASSSIAAGAATSSSSGSSGFGGGGYSGGGGGGGGVGSW